MGDVSWIKIKVDMFDDEKIKLLQALPEGDAILVIWVRLITLAGKSNAKGYLLIGSNVPYTEEMLVTIIGKPISIIRLALTAFENYEMIERSSGTILLVNFEKHQSLDRLNEIREYNRVKQKEHRERTKSLNSKSLDYQNSSCISVNDGSLTCQTCQCTEEDKEIEEDLELDKEKEADEQWKNIIDTFNSICNKLPKVTYIDETQKRKIKKLIKTFDEVGILPSMNVHQRMEHIFRSVSESDFLSGRRRSNIWCTFDWIITVENATKIVVGNYINYNNGASEDNQNKRRTNSFNDYPQRKYTEQDYIKLENKLIGNMKL
jgi:predicted phage replisome organizer